MAIARTRFQLAGVLLILSCFGGLATARAAAAAGPPVALTAPAISGSPVIGQTLSVSNGTWLNGPTSFEYQWVACTLANGCSGIAGATGNTLTLNQSFLGDTLVAQVVAVNASGSSNLTPTAPTSPVIDPPQGAPQSSIRVTSSVNPAQINDAVLFKADLSAGMAGGSLTFYENEQPIPGCAALTVSAQASNMTCTTSFDLTGSWKVTVGYSYPYDGSTPVTLTGGMTETVTRGARVVPAPPTEQVGAAGPKGLPNFRLSVLAVRSTRIPHRFWFALERVTCVDHASAVLVKIGKRTVTDRCGARIELASSSLAVHRYYRLTLQAVRSKGNRIVLRGPAYRERLFMPGNEVQWSAITGVKSPISGAAAT